MSQAWRDRSLSETLVHSFRIRAKFAGFGVLIEVLRGSFAVNADHFGCETKMTSRALMLIVGKELPWNSCFMLSLLAPRGSLTCVGPYQTSLSQSGFVGQNFETLQAYNPKTEGSVDILEDLWAIASATDPTGSPRINAQGISARSAVMEI